MATISDSVDLSRLSDRTADDLRTLRGMAQNIAALLLQRRRELQAIKSDPMISALAMQQKTQAANQRAKDTLDGYAADVQAAERSIRQAVADLTQGRQTTEEALLREMQMQRAWQRFKILLDSGADVMVVVERAAGDPIAIEALRQELPAYLEAHSKSDFIKPALELLDRQERPLLRPVEARGRDLLAELDKGMRNLRLAFSHAEAELSGAWQQTTVLVGWSGETIQVAERG